VLQRANNLREGETPMASMQGEAVQGEAGLGNAGAPSRNRLWPGLAALLLVVLAITTALWSWYQSPDALQNQPAWAQWLLKPYERNAFAQLDFVGGDIRGSFARADALWLVGNNGLLLQSRDGGVSWQADARINWRPSTAVVPVAAKKTTQLALFTPAYAEMPPSKFDYGVPSNSSPSNNLPSNNSASTSAPSNNAKAGWLQKSAVVQDLQQPEQKAALKESAVEQAPTKQTPVQQAPIKQNPASKQIQQQVLQQQQQQQQPLQIPQQLLPSAANQAPRESNGGPVDLHAITFFDQQRGIAVGDAGAILLTQDGGASWSARHSGVVSALNAVAYVDAVTAIAVGDNGNIVLSRDGGNRWERVASGVVIDLHGITLQDNGGLIVVGAGGCILRSIDGVNWDGQWREPRQTLRAVATLQQRVIAVGDAGTVLQSNDGGANWQSTSIAPVQLNAVLALGQQGHWLAVGEAAGGAAVAWHSTDDGGRWQAQTLRGNWASLRTASHMQGGTGVTTVLAAGAGGTVLQLQSPLQLQGTTKPLVRGVDKAITSVVVLRDAFLAAGGDLLLHSTDGAHWNAVSVPATASINALQRVDKRVAVAVGERGLILRTANGGSSWQVIDSGIALPLLTAAANGDGVVVAAGVMGTVLRSADSGKTWRVIDSGAAALDIVAAAFSSPTTAVLSTNEGTVLRSVDAGLSWQRLDTAPTAVIREFAFADARNGIAVGDTGLILRTANGGKTWQAVNNEFSSTLRSVLYLDSNRVLAGGDDGVLIESRDGGSSWHVFAAWQGIGASVSALAFGDVSAFTDTSRLVVAAQDGAVFSAAGSDGSLRAAAYQRYPSPLVLLLSLAALITMVPAWHRRQPGPALQDSVADLLVSDRPLAPGDADYMDFSRRAAQLSRFLRHEKTELPVTIAISAEWGRGKSSLMNLMAEDLASNGFRPVWFNAWHHQKEGHLLASLLRAVQKQALPYALTPSGFLMRVQLLSHRGAWYLIAAAFPVVLLSALIVYFSANPERLAAVGPNVRYMLNIENPVTITSQSMAKLEQAAKGEHEKMLKYWLPVLDDFRKTRHVFVDTDEMIFAMRQRQHPSAAVISSELVAEVIKSAEHLRPQTRVFPELGNVWTGISAVFAALVGAVTMVLNGMSVFGLRRTRAGGGDNNEKTGSRERIAADFSRLTEVLGKRLVIMIDDLDRCSRENLLDMLEHVNFLSSEGECAIVVAMAYDRVVNHLAVCLAEDAGRKVDAGPNETDRAEAHFYLHKLIQLMVTIRPPRLDETRKMLIGRHGMPIRKRKPWKRTLVALWRHTQPWVIILALAYAGVLAGSRGLQLLSPTPTLKLLEQRISALQQETATTTATAVVSEPAPAARQTPAPTRSASGFREAQKSAFPWWLLAVAAAAVLLSLGFVVLYRDPQLRKQLANRLRLALAVAVREQDSSLFVRALQLWHGVIADHLQSPRALKRFLNRLRFLAMGVMSAQSDGDATEAHVVALAALGIDNIDLEFSKLSPAQKALLDQHIAIFGRAPNEEERELYLDLMGEVDRLAMVGMV